MALQEYIARFSGSTPAPQLDESDSRAVEIEFSKPVELGKAPPCESYASLKPMYELLDGVQKYHACTQPSHMKDCSSFCVDMCRVLDLLPLVVNSLACVLILQGCDSLLELHQKPGAAAALSDRAGREVLEECH